MKIRYKNVDELIRAIGSRAFRVMYYLTKSEIPLEDYQDLCRIYLDEYSEQKELREKWFAKNRQKKFGEVLHVHHINYNKKDCLKTNLITTCKVCNIKANFNRDYWYAFYKYIIEEITYGK